MLRQSLLQAGRALASVASASQAGAAVPEIAALPSLAVLRSRIAESIAVQQHTPVQQQWQQRQYATRKGSKNRGADDASSSSSSNDEGTSSGGVPGIERFREWAASEGAKNESLQRLIKEVGGGKGDLDFGPAFEAVMNDFIDAIGRTRHELEDAALAKKNEEVQALTDKLGDLTDGYKRALAEVENVRKRAEKQQAQTKDFAIQGFAKSLLDVADNLERAAEAVPQQSLEEAESDPNKAVSLLRSLLQGVKMTQSTLLQALRSNGVESYDPKGEPFDPELHNALFKVQDPDLKPAHVAVVIKRGYKLKDRVLRAADVGVTPST